MNHYCAFLRGVNVNGISMKMQDLSLFFTQLGMQEVQSILATGNVLFSSDKNAVVLKELLQNQLSEHFCYDAFLFIKTYEEVLEIYHQNPFRCNENESIYVLITENNNEQILWKAFLESEKKENETGEIRNNTLYWKVPKAQTLNSSFGKLLGKKAFKTLFTSRNLNTIEKITNKISPI